MRSVSTPKQSSSSSTFGISKRSAAAERKGQAGEFRRGKLRRRMIRTSVGQEETYGGNV